VAGSVFLAALAQQAQPIPVLDPGPDCSGSGPLPASCFAPCLGIPQDPSAWPAAPTSSNTDDSAWHEASFCGVAAHTTLNAGVAIGAAQAGLTAYTSQLQQNLTGPEPSDSSKLANVRCNFNPSYVQSNPAVFGGKPRPVCEFVVRAKRINVMPDQVELVWFDGPSLSPVPQSELSNEALSVYLLALGQGKAGSLCTRAPASGTALAIHPFAHVSSE
jgi:hypothetical protein